MSLTHAEGWAGERGVVWSGYEKAFLIPALCNALYGSSYRHHGLDL